MARKSYRGSQRGLDPMTRRRGLAMGTAVPLGLAATTLAAPIVGPTVAIAAGTGAAYGVSRAIYKRGGKFQKTATSKRRTARQQAASRRNLARARARRKRR